ncbi:MAG: hypothetical protein HBSAPP03_20320 [Phycisphaerae bacterium]|nr:MAG: hypothetical protein HBSAPP03_20320 [Phycisphaerae bacterium]
MAKNIKLLLVENVESVGIVGDVVNVRTGFARNFLLPRNLATTPSDELVKSLAAKRAEAERMVAAQRKQREETSERLKGVEMELTRSCNDQGILYGGITQQDVATELTTRGYAVKARDVRLPGAIKRIDKYEIHVKLDSDLDAIVKLTVKPDREMPKDAVEAAPTKGDAKGEAKSDAKDGGKPEAATREPREERRSRRDDYEDRREKAMRRRADMIEHAIASDKARVVGWGKKEGEAAAAETADAGAKPDAEKKPAKGEKADKAEKKPKAEKTDAKGEKAKK